MSYTKGPWKASFTMISHVVADNGALIAKCNKLNGLVNLEANARLISAAPDLLEALVLLEREMVLSGNASSVDYGWKPAIEKTWEAIEKATGVKK